MIHNCSTRGKKNPKTNQNKWEAKTNECLIHPANALGADMTAEKRRAPCVKQWPKNHGQRLSPVHWRNNPRDQRLESCSSHVMLNSPRQLSSCPLVRPGERVKRRQQQMPLEPPPALSAHLTSACMSTAVRSFVSYVDLRHENKSLQRWT